MDLVWNFSGIWNFKLLYFESFRHDIYTFCYGQAFACAAFFASLVPLFFVSLVPFFFGYRHLSCKLPYKMVF